ncbi:hypothetical protein GQ600_16019 [Phytophthora cactorum]|nr:hypothetical protein GQ600_16019 [Phytophthora cactorum]
MVKRRGQFKLKVQLPADEDTDSVSEREVKREDVDSSDSSFDESSSSESEVGMKNEKSHRKSDTSSSSSGSSSEEDSEVEEKPPGRNVRALGAAVLVVVKTIRAHPTPTAVRRANQRRKQHA